MPVQAAGPSIAKHPTSSEQNQPPHPPSGPSQSMTAADTAYRGLHQSPQTYDSKDAMSPDEVMDEGSDVEGGDGDGILDDDDEAQQTGTSLLRTALTCTCCQQ